MSRWFRHYAGLCRDEKLVRAALRAQQPIERVVWVYAAILESASEINDGGRYDFDIGEASYFLRASEDDVRNIVNSLESLGRLCEGTVARWGDRQFKSDTSAERQKNYRHRKKSSHDNTGDCQVTAASRHGDAPETETETETEKKPSSAAREGSFELECRKAVGEEPVLVALDFHSVQAIVDSGEVTEADVLAGIREAMAAPNFRIKHWRQIPGWARGAARNRLSATEKPGARAGPARHPPRKSNVLLAVEGLLNDEPSRDNREPSHTGAAATARGNSPVIDVEPGAWVSG